MSHLQCGLGGKIRYIVYNDQASSAIGAEVVAVDNDALAMNSHTNGMKTVLCPFILNDNQRGLDIYTQMRLNNCKLPKAAPETFVIHTRSQSNYTPKPCGDRDREMKRYIKYLTSNNLPKSFNVINYGDLPLYFPEKCCLTLQALPHTIKGRLMLHNVQDRVNIVWSSILPTHSYSGPGKYFVPTAMDLFNYDPRNGAGFQPSFLKRFIGLPKEIRYEIYRLIAFGWDSKLQFPMTALDCTYQIGVARRNFKPALQLLALDENFPSDAHRKAWMDSNDFYQRGGMLDYFKGIEYRNLEGFIHALEVFEGRSYSRKVVNGVLRPGESRLLSNVAQKSLGVLEDFLDWLWDNIVLDLTSEIRGTSSPRHEGPSQAPKHISVFQNRLSMSKHSYRINHITFKFYSPHMSELTDFCGHLKSHLPNLKTLRLFLYMSDNEAEKLVLSEGNVEWIHAINDLPILDKFDFHFFTWQRNFPINVGSVASLQDHENVERLQQLRKSANALLKKKLKPISLMGQGDDMGLSEMLEKF